MVMLCAGPGIDSGRQRFFHGVKKALGGDP